MVVVEDVVAAAAPPCCPSSSFVVVIIVVGASFSFFFLLLSLHSEDTIVGGAAVDPAVLPLLVSYPPSLPSTPSRCLSHLRGIYHLVELKRRRTQEVEMTKRGFYRL